MFPLPDPNNGAAFVPESKTSLVSPCRFKNGGTFLLRFFMLFVMIIKCNHFASFFKDYLGFNSKIPFSNPLQRSQGGYFKPENSNVILPLTK